MLVDSHRRIERVIVLYLTKQCGDENQVQEQDKTDPDHEICAALEVGNRDSSAGAVTRIGEQLWFLDQFDSSEQMDEANASEHRKENAELWGESGLNRR
jgi:hypothetical protein